jgi:inorganic pyrophosphatase
MPAPTSLRSSAALFARHFDWPGWARLIDAHGLTIDRPFGQPHPAFPHIVYPLDYGYINDTRSSDGEPVDVFVGSAATGLVGLILAADYRQHKREPKLLYHCTAPEVYTAHGFINYDRSLLEGALALRQPMHKLWEAAAPS